MLHVAFRSLWIQVLSGFVVSFFLFYQTQIVTEANRPVIFVSLLIAILFCLLASAEVDKIQHKRYYRIKVFLSTFLTITQYIVVWALISIVSKFLIEALQSVFTFDAIYRLIVMVLFVSGCIAITSDPEEAETKK